MSDNEKIIFLLQTLVNLQAASLAVFSSVNESKLCTSNMQTIDSIIKDANSLIHQTMKKV